MHLRRFYKTVGATAAFAAIILAGMSISSTHGQAQSALSPDEAKIEQGFDIAPVPLNLVGRNRALVGLGSYIVNALADCNGCHTRDASTEYTDHGNPYFLPPPNGPFKGRITVNPATYLGGGNDFGPYPGLQHLYTRNLTPDKTGRPEGGHTLQEFITIMRTGKDYDHLHPTCTGAPNGSGSCVPAPFNGDVLQIMPWPTFKNMSDGDLRAIYEYLSAIPCIDTIIDGAPILRNNCPKK